MLFLELKDNRAEKVKYDHSDYPIYIRRELLSSFSEYTAPAHWHDEIEFIAVLSGKMQYNINGKIITITENEGIIVNTRQMHFGFSPKKEECDFICILLHPLMLCASYAYERDFVLPVIRNKKAAFVKLDGNILWQKNTLEDIRHMYAVKDKKIAPIEIQRLFLNIWINLYENITPECSTKEQNTELSVLKEIIGFIQQNYHRKISLADIAAAGAVGQSKCCKLFADYIGQTPNLYLMRYRLDKSAELLKSSDMPITEIAFAVGFGGSSYYAEAFRRWYGKSPTEYRKCLQPFTAIHASIRKKNR